MNQSVRKYSILTLVSCVLMFVWIAVMAALIGGKEMEDFSTSDRSIFIIFCIVELLTVGLTCFFTWRVVKARRISGMVLQDRKTGNGAWGVVCVFVAVLTTVLFYPLKMPQSLISAAKAVVIADLIVVAVLYCVGLLLRKIYIRRISARPVQQMQEYFLAHREAAEQVCTRGLRRLRFIRRLTFVYAILLVVLAVLMLSCASVILKQAGPAIGFWALGLLLLMGACFHFFFSQSTEPTQQDGLIGRDEYTALYTLAERAAESLGVHARIRILLSDDANAGILLRHGTCFLSLGGVMLAVMSEEELYRVLLHEFSHIAGDKKAINRERMYFERLQQQIDSGKRSKFFVSLFSFLHAVYIFRYAVFDYAVSVMQESDADRAMIRPGDPTAAASALIKLKYYELFEWEHTLCDTPALYESEVPDGQFLQKKIDAFRCAIPGRARDWNRLIGAEITSRSASHPILRTRLEALGAEDYKVLEYTGSEEYLDACRRAIDMLQKQITEQIVPQYPQLRQEYYIRPAEQLAEWEQTGEELRAETYAGLVNAMLTLGQVSRAETLCDRVIAELPAAAACYACFTKGRILLYRYDPAGIDLLYRAMENREAIEPGLELIGSFCCLTGRQEELDTYREKAMTYAQQEQDGYSQVSELKKGDRLVAEHLPAGLQEQILAFIASLDDGSIRNLYLVRKIVSEELFVSAWVVRFDRNTDAAVKEEMMNRIYWYLDTGSDWRFTLYDYDGVLPARVDKVPGSCVYERKQTPAH